MPAASPAQTPPAGAFDAPGRSNPVLPGYFADPSVLEHDGRYYLYATVDPWGAETLGCWESANFRDWTYAELNWPTKQACTSPTSGGAKVWAPSVVKGRDGRFYMYVSVGSEVWAGVAEAPTGPWRNALGDRPMIAGDFRPGYHMIDAEAFIDDDGAAYLYWGSGWNWINGKCWVAKLGADMASFDGEVRDVTPTNYFEAPFMTKRGDTYYLMYSNGKTTEDTYEVRYAMGTDPMGPFVEGPNSPVIVTDVKRHVISPGHHAMFRKDGVDYMVYHRRAMPESSSWGRQICVDRQDFGPGGEMLRITPTHDGATELQMRCGLAASSEPANLAAGATATASSVGDDAYAPRRLLDGNYATRWAPVKDAAGPHWVALDLGSAVPVMRSVLRPEFATRTYRFRIEGSADGQAWRTLAEHTKDGLRGSPLVVETPGEWRHLRLTFAEGVATDHASLWEWRVE